MFGAVEGAEAIRDERPGAEPVLRPRMSTIARVASGSAASWFHLCIGLASQLFSVPLFLSHWTPAVRRLDWHGSGGVADSVSRLRTSQLHRMPRRCGSALNRATNFEALRIGGPNRTDRKCRRAALVVGLVWHGVLGALLGEQSVGDPLLRDAGLILILQSTLWLSRETGAAVAGRVLIPFGYFPHIAWFQASVAVATAIAQAVALMLGAKLLAVGVAYHGTFALCSWVGTVLYQKGDCEGAALGA